MTSAHGTYAQSQASSFPGNPSSLPVEGCPATMNMMEPMITLIHESYSQCYDCYRLLRKFAPSRHREPGPYRSVALAAPSNVT